MGIFSVVNDLNSIKYVTNSFVLKHDNWNDYWEFKTLYGLDYIMLIETEILTTWEK